jgi:hypothetical protein
MLIAGRGLDREAGFEALRERQNGGEKDSPLGPPLDAPNRRKSEIELIFLAAILAMRHLS